jgi:DNA-binding CsgD family transcriptional regulator
VPFTNAEAERDARKAKLPNWIFDFLRKWHYADGLVCTYRHWATVYVSSRLIVLSPVNRVLLSAIAQVAIGQIEVIVNAKRKRLAKKPDSNILTEREEEVLQQRAFSSRPVAIAEQLGINVETVNSHLKSARRKLETDDIAIALLQALKRGLIEY